MPEVERKHCCAIRKVLQHSRGKKGADYVIRKVTNPYGLCIYSFLAFEEVTKTHGLRKTPPFDFRHITEFSRIA